jgi:hypothetical protein
VGLYFHIEVVFVPVFHGDDVPGAGEFAHCFRRVIEEIV